MACLSSSRTESDKINGKSKKQRKPGDSLSFMLESSQSITYSVPDSALTLHTFFIFNIASYTNSTSLLELRTTTHPLLKDNVRSLATGGRDINCSLVGNARVFKGVDI